MMSSLYFQYIKERENLDFVEIEEGFFTYKINGDECYLNNVFLKPEHRGTPATIKIMNKIIEAAQSRDCKLISANVYLNDHGFHRTIKSALKLGFSFVLAQNNCVTIVKKLGE